MLKLDLGISEIEKYCDLSFDDSQARAITRKAMISNGSGSVVIMHDVSSDESERRCISQ